MNSTLNQFNRVAGVYDILARIVFGKSIQRAQLHFLNELPTQGNILILGGGTGWILKSILKVRPLISIWFVEASDAMIAKAKQQIGKDEARIHFIHGTEENLGPEVQFDAMIANFYFDLFRDASLKGVIGLIRHVMHPDSVWLVTDFNDQRKWWQVGLLRIMYWFFRLCCDIEANELPRWQDELKRNGLQPIKDEKFFNGFICTTVFLQRLNE